MSRLTALPLTKTMLKPHKTSNLGKYDSELYDTMVDGT